MRFKVHLNNVLILLASFQWQDPLITCRSLAEQHRILSKSSKATYLYVFMSVFMLLQFPGYTSPVVSVAHKLHVPCPARRARADRLLVRFAGTTQVSCRWHRGNAIHCAARGLLKVLASITAGGPYVTSRQASQPPDSSCSILYIHTLLRQLIIVKITST